MNISGLSISEINQNIDQLSGNDLFLISRNTNKILCDYKSYNVSYDVVSSEVMARLSSHFGYGSMAFKQSSDYSLVDHTHSCYNIIQIESINQYKRSIPIANMYIDGTKIELCAYVPDFEYQNEPVPGQLKFMALKEIKDINTSSDSFDGWVYPDGSYYNVDDFSCSYYFEHIDDKTFKVPDLKDFIYAVNDVNSYIGLRCGVNEQIGGMKRHNHSYNATCTGKAVGKFSMYGSPDANIGLYAHSNFTDNKKYRIPINFKMTDVSISSDDVISSSVCEKEEGLTHPTYDNIPVFIYIGKMIKRGDNVDN